MKYKLSLLVFLIFVVFYGCPTPPERLEDLDLENNVDPIITQHWVGTWLSAEENVAPILIAGFKYDSLRLILSEDNTITIESHIKDNGWTNIQGAYNITESVSGGIHAINMNFTEFEQEGIIEVTAGVTDKLKLEVVQTVPDFGAVPRNPTTGFGSDQTLGNMNIQTYIRLD